MKAKEFLLQLQKLDRLIENKEYEKQQWKDIATSTTVQTTGERVQSSGSKDKMANAITRYLDIEKEINADIDRYIEKKREIINVIEQLNAVEYDILHKRYIQNMSFDEIMLLNDKSQSWVTTVHGRALKHVQDILDEK